MDLPSYPNCICCYSGKVGAQCPCYSLMIRLSRPLSLKQASLVNRSHCNTETQRDCCLCSILGQDSRKRDSSPQRDCNSFISPICQLVSCTELTDPTVERGRTDPLRVCVCVFLHYFIDYSCLLLRHTTTCSWQ